jgi:ribosomal-protein-alanine N-acetyltransferase
VNLRLVSCRERHLLEVHRIEQDSYPRPWSLEGLRYEITGNPVAICRVAIRPDRAEGRQVAGYACAWVVAGEMKLNNLTVAARDRRQGIGRALLTHLMDLARERGCHRLTLEVREGNRPARALYGAFGFRVVGRRPGYYQPEGDDALLLTLDLG